MSNNTDGVRQYEDLKVGDVFTVGNTPSYPKLKLKEGYVDMRDKILNKTGDTVKGREVSLLTASDIAKEFDDTELGALDWILSIKKEYLS